MTFDQAAELIATRTRSYLKDKGRSASSDTPDPLHVLPPTPGGGDSNRVPIKKPDGSSAPAYNPDKAYEEDMRDYAKERNAERSGVKKG